MASPYTGYSISEWSKITAELISRHPLDLDIIREVALEGV